MSSQRAGTAAGASRAQVLDALRSRSRPMAVEAVAQAVGLSANTVRFHLDRLRREGAVTRESTRPDRPGRPHQVYRAVAAEAVEDAAAYRLLAGLLADGLVRSGNLRATVEAGRSWADRLVASHDPSVGASAGADDNASAVARVVELSEDGGFAPELLADASTVALYRCPFRELASVRADVVCTVHLGFIRGALQRLQEVADAAGRLPHGIEPELVQLNPVPDGSGPCLFTLPVPRVVLRTG